ncbi:hypothetical protein [Agrococcus jejuensis]|uniref:Uncharacterized protein n=1 Tax=Agrococcus jejuensis TaxID=399736 RepID=A0A1G8BM41_9MICO|nr:hypothetical protein [Agrococcus jejuensis]SDH34173.1 hypothetical protein SAMN04489720_0989 [Agrococcus jejuensis]
MTRTVVHEAALTLDVALLRTAARRLGRDGARLATIVVATWATIAVAAGGVVMALGIRLGVVAGMPVEPARAIVVAAMVATVAVSLVRLACGTGLASRLAAPDALRAALGVRPRAGIALGAAVHVWMLGAATLPLAVTWSTWDAAPGVGLCVSAVGVAALAGCLLLACASSDRRALRPHGGAVLGSVHRAEVSALIGAATFGAMGMLPTAAALRDAAAEAAAALAGAGAGVAASAVVAGVATIVASDRLLEADARSRLRRARALLDAGASRASVVARLVRPAIVAWALLAASGCVASAVWGASTSDAVGVGGAILAVGAAAAALAMGADAPASRVVASAIVVAIVAIAPGWSTLALAALAIGAAVATTARRLRCPPS